MGDIVIYRADACERQDCPKFYRVSEVDSRAGCEEYGSAFIVEIGFDDIDVTGDSRLEILSRLRHDQHAVKALRSAANNWNQLTWKLCLALCME